MRTAAIALLLSACGADVVVGGAPESSTPSPQSCQPSGCPPCTGAHVWSTGFGSQCRDVEPRLSVDRAGNVVVIGLGGSSEPCGQRDVLVAKWSAGGEPQWTRAFGNDAYQKAHAVETDANGNIVLVGEFDGTPLDFGGGPVSGTGFLVKLGPDGSHVWSRGFEGLVYGVETIASDESSDFFVSGRFNRTIDLGGGPIAPDPPTNLGSLFNLFIAKFAASGAHLWSVKWAEPQSYGQGALAVGRDGSIVLAGPYFDWNGALKSFVVKLDSGGAQQWRRNFSTSEGVNIDDVAVDDDSIVVGGLFRGIGDFGTGRIDARGLAMWAGLYDAHGGPRWVRQFASGHSSKLVSDVDIDPTGNVILAGASADGVDLGGGALSSEPSKWNPFVAKFDACGNHLWSRSVGATDANDWWPRVGLMPGRDIVVVGQLSSLSEPVGVDLGGGPLHAMDELDFLVASFAP